MQRLKVTLSKTNTEKPLPPWEASTQALSSTQRRYSLPANTSVNELIQENYAAYQYYRKEYYKLLNQTHDQPNASDKTDTLERWKAHMLEQLAAVRLENFLRAVRAAGSPAESKHTFVLIRKHDLEEKGVNLQLQDILQADIDFVSSDNVEDDLITDFAQHLFGTKTALEVGHTLSLVPSIFQPAILMGGLGYGHIVYWGKNRDNFIPLLSGSLDAMGGSVSHDYLTYARIDFSASNSPAALKIKQTFGPVHYIAQKDFQAVIRGLLAKLSVAPSKASAKTIAIIDAAEKDAMLSMLQSLLSIDTSAQSMEKLDEQLKLEANSKLSRISVKNITYADIASKERLNLAPDLIDGLKWWGYQDSASFWKVRDTLADLENLPHFDELSTDPPAKPRLGAKVRNMYNSALIYFSRTTLRRNITSAVTWTALWFAAISGPDAVRTYYHGSENSAGQTTGEYMQSIDYAQLAITDADEMDDLSNITAYEVIPENGATAPQYYNLPTNLQLVSNGSRHYEFPDSRERHLTIRTKVPNHADSFLRIPLILPKQHKLQSINLKTNNRTLQYSKDYLVLEIRELGLLYLTLLEKPEGSFEIETSYVKDENFRPLAVTFEPEKMQQVNSEMQERGFQKLYENLEVLAINAKRDNREVTLAELEQVFRNSSVYTFRKPDVALPGGIPGIYHLALLLENGCMYGQCNAGAPLFEYYASQYYKLEPRSSRTVENMWAFMDENSDHRLTMNENHLHNRIVDASENTYVDLDATPGLPDKRPIDNPLIPFKEAIDELPEFGLPERRQSISELVKMTSGDDPTIPDDTEILTSETSEVRDAKAAMTSLLLVAERTKKLINNPTFRQLSLTKRKRSPSYWALQLAADLKLYSEGHIAQKDIVDRLRSIAGIEHPATGTVEHDVRIVVDATIAKVRAAIKSMRNALTRNPNLEFAFMNDDTLVSDISGILQALESASWIPIQTTDAVGACEELKALQP